MMDIFALNDCSSVLFSVILSILFIFHTNFIIQFADSALNDGARLTLTPLDAVVEVNTKVNFFCRIDGNPLPTVTWKRNGKTISQARYITETLTNGLSTLRIEPVREKDNNSLITCSADNGKGQGSNASAQLIVLKAEELPEGFPVVVEDPKLRAVEKNHSATMTCSVKGDPRPVVVWLKDLMPVDMANPRYSIATLGSLVIQNSEEVDEGKYECVARNEKGVVHSRSAHLYVKVRRVPPQFSIPPRRLYHVTPGGTVSMNCVAYGHPMPRVFWRRAHTNEDLERPETAPVGKNVLTLTNVQKTENFSCVAYSSLGNINSEVTVEVKALPPPPEVLKVTNVSARSVALAWSNFQPPNDDFVRQYVIKYKPKYSDGDDYLEGEVTKNLETIITGLEPYTEYEFRVHTVVDIGRSKPSRPVEVTTGEALPETPPKNVQSRPLSATNVLIQWEPPEKPNGQITTYKVYFTSKETDPYTMWPTKEIAEGRMAQINDLTPDRLYTIRVQAKNAVGYGPVSEPVLVYTKTGIPGQPVNVRATSVGASEVALSWDPPLHPDVKHYVIRYNSTATDHRTAEVPGSVTDHKINQLKANSDYTFQISAKSQRGEGAPSKMVTVRTGASVPSGAPEGVIVEAVSSTSVRVMWEPPSKTTRNGLITSYRIVVHRKLLDNKPPSSNNNNDLSDEDSSAHIFDPADPDTDSADQDPDESVEIPRLKNNSAAAMTDEEPPPAATYEQSADKQRSFLVEGLQSYTYYAVTVAAGTAVGYGPESDPPVEIRTQADVPGPPRDVQATVLNETSVRLTWDEPSDKNGPISGYFVELDELNDENQFVLQKPMRNFMSTKETVLVNLKPNTKYSARVSAYNPKGDGVVSKAKIFKTLPLRPLPPKNVKAELLTSENGGVGEKHKNLKVRIKWEAPENLKNVPKHFLFKYKLKDDHKYNEILLQNVLQHDVDHLKHGRMYEFRVAALYDGQYSEEGWNSIITPPGIPEAAPFDVRYEYVADERVLSFTWNEIPPETRNGDITRYQTLLEGGNSNPVNREVAENKASYQGINANEKYEFKVRAGTSTGFGPWSNGTVVEPMLADQFLVDIVELTAMSDSEAGIRWLPLTDTKVQGYRIRYTKEASIGSWKFKDVNGRGQDHTFIDHLEPKATYQFCVQALIDDKKISECASHKTLTLKPIYVVRDLEYEMLEPKVARLSWTYDGPEPAIFKVYYDLNKMYRMDNGRIRNISYTAPVDNVTDTQVDVTSLRYYTNYTFKVSVIYDHKVYLPQRKNMTTGVEPPPNFDAPKVVENYKPHRKDVILKLNAAADENGPVLMYWLVIAPSSYQKNTTDLIENAELMNENDIYVAAEFTQNQLWSMKNQSFAVGTGQNFTGMSGGTYHNKPLNYSRRYKAFLRAFVGPPGGKNDRNFKSSPWSTEFGLSAPHHMHVAPADSNLWIIALVALFVVVAIIMGGICLFLMNRKKKKILNAKRTSGAKMTLGGLGGPTETSKLLMVNDYGMPPPINGNVKPYDTNVPDGIYGSYGAGTEPLPTTLDMKRGSQSHYPTPPVNSNLGGATGPHPPIPVLEFANHVERLKANDNLHFSREYESIETDQQFTWEQSNKDVNKPKNRYANVISYDHSRVVLSLIDGILGSDYINANYIDGYRKPKAYIATQGPLPETFGDFWRMIWEENSATIVMLTKLEERTRIKCDQYWPTRSTQSYGLIHVTAKETHEFAHYTLRSFDIYRPGFNELREVKQLQFTAWPDHGVPDHPTPFLMFLKRVKALNPPDSGPIVVHCSAGVGRTGAFIVIDNMLDRLRYENTLDVYGCVAAIRCQRNYMVQTEDQYVFIHEAVLDAVQSGCTEVPVNKLYTHIQKLMQINPMDNASSMELEFRILANLKINNVRFTAASLPANKQKNRLVNILPYDSNRVCLMPTPIAPEGELNSADYINASYVDGYRRRRAYIATQGPLPNTVEDFWRMLWEQNSSIVVMLTKLREMGREKCYQYWPSDRGERYGALMIEPIAEYNMPQYILREFKATDTRDGQSRTVRHFQYTEWPEQGVPKSGEYFIEFIGQVHKTKEQFGQEGPITVHCSAGVGRTGVFICLSIVLERMRYEGVVDIFTMVKLLRTQRANMVQSEDQYHFCYRAALEYLGSFDHYALQNYE